MNEENKATLLLVEDEAPQRRILAGYLAKRGYRVVEAGDAAAAVLCAESEAPDLLLSDLRLGGPDGVDLLHRLRERHPDMQAILLTAYAAVEDAVRAMRAGAYDFLAKPVDLDRLEVLIEKALETSRLARENRTLRRVLEASDAFAGLIGESEAMRRVKAMAAKAAPAKSSVLILGESGTGKEVLARALHLAGPRRDGPFVTVNCAALPETLIESELFGHEKGAFTGADRQRKGRFEAAFGGTLFLDEVGEIPLAMQVKLLNVLQSGHFERVGGTETLTANVRILAATNRNLAERVKEGAFREDLFYRLNVIPITMPALRERPDDIPRLAAHFLAKHRGETDVRGVSEAALAALQRYAFPGNVRELEHLIERALVLAEGPWLGPEDFPLSGTGGTEGAPPEGGLGLSLDMQVEVFERAKIAEALALASGNQSAAARALGLSERTIRYKLKKYGL